MIKIIRPRGFGKTKKLIRLSAKSGDYIVCHSFDECSRIQSIAIEMGLSIHFPITYYEFINKHYNGKGINGFLIDNADDLIQYISKVPIKAITLTE